MRLLFTFAGGSGHFLPAIPIARAAVARGNTVAFSAQEMMRGAVEAAGFRRSVAAAARSQIRH